MKARAAKKIGILLLLFSCMLVFLFAIPFNAVFSSDVEINMDPETKTFLHAFNKVKSCNVDIQALRKVVFLPSSVPVQKTEDIFIQGDLGLIPCRLYTPFGEGPFPVYIAFGGGGWVSGNLESNDAQCREICCRSGFLVLSVNYHKAPEHPFPQPLEDCYAALLWAAEHIQEFGGDSARLTLGGDSAGGNLAAATALLARDRKGPTLQAQVLLYPVTNYSFDTLSYNENGEGYLLTRESMKMFWSSYLGEEEGKNKYASPLQAQLEGLPPTLIIIADYDPLRDEGLDYAYKLKKFGVAVTILQYPTIHGFISFSKQIRLGEEALEKIALFLKNSL
ncbi:MAG: alpha/beta hydrolase [Candidatus Protochlamydia sp.]|nr:alpha/beta hydrolase [Candidatus Protochlamydia sp.]